jgi:hypothetical protein
MLSVIIFNNRHNTWRCMCGQTCGPKGCHWRCCYQSGRGNDVFPQRQDLLQDCKSGLDFQWAMEEELGGSAHMGLETTRGFAHLHLWTFGT